MSTVGKTFFSKSHPPNTTATQIRAPSPANTAAPRPLNRFAKNAAQRANPPPVRLPPNRRRRQAPARGPAAVYALCRRNRNETQHPSPLLMGLGCVNTPPKALAAGTAGPKAAGPCSWACRRLHAQPFHSERNAADPPPARGAGLRLLRAKGTGCRHCRPPARGAWVRLLRAKGTGRRHSRPPCSWGLGASTSSQRHWSPAQPAPRTTRPAFCPARGRFSDRG